MSIDRSLDTFFSIPYFRDENYIKPQGKLCNSEDAKQGHLCIEKSKGPKHNLIELSLPGSLKDIRPITPLQMERRS